ncbi:glycosyltransferase [Mesorhizobium sp. RMAD-H1]|uniref:glycosyltransferase n=1 Tax=Mesorhizobium sp. RMAD-H1 TaxID=2587065 RepID=UPI00160DE051|nr:glycosyltransferase [Mesorhizobium sp. RMAD-H1]MBB2971423.1 GT2 family glycosyltransferase/glycosyltransferase involved in cell wall biosynthesis [Mesorhizobium sp. RMAD-H1]
MRNFKKTDVELIRASGLFDADWYIEQYPDVKALRMDPAEHYLWLGARLARNPSRKFDTIAYLNENVDVNAAGVNPLLHYLRWGRNEGRKKFEQRHLVNIPNVKVYSTPATVSRDLNSAFTRIAKKNTPPSIIIPIYNAPEETENCIKSVLRHTSPDVRLMLINDASPDPRVRETLSRYADVPNVTIVHNERNLGFTRTINKGIDLAGSTDVVFLNSDTKVTPFWLRNLQLAAYSDERIATATPFSNNAGAFSAPVVGKENPIPSGLSLDNYARLITRNSGRAYPYTPTGNGFCMYVRRECIEQIGILDAEAFPRGYGEENDFCMRAGKAGWRHVIDDSTLVYHVRSASFGDEKTPLMKQGRAIIDHRYPEYTKLVREFLADPVLERARKAVGESIYSPDFQHGIRPRALFVVSTRTGGTPQTNSDLMEKLQDRYETFLLRCDAKTIELFHVEGRNQSLLEAFQINKMIKAFPHTSDEYDAAVKILLVKYSIEVVHIRHIAWHSLALPKVCKQLDIPVVFSFHDFYTICPTVKLLDERLEYCGGVCTATSGQCKHELWSEPDFPPLKNSAIHNWQSSMREMLRYCDGFITTSSGSRETISKIFDNIQDKPFEVIPHGRDLEMLSQVHAEAKDRKKLRILVPGNIDTPKGANIIKEIARYDENINFEFHILGKTTLEAGPNLILHGGYKREDFQSKVKEIDPDIGAIFSIWPETYCHTLTEMWSCGLPVVALDFGAVGERIRAEGGGWLLSTKDPKRIFSELCRITGDPLARKRESENVLKWQRKTGLTHTALRMSHYYDQFYRKILARRSITRSKPDGRPNVGVLTPSTTNASGQIRIMEKIRDSLDRSVRYDVISNSDVNNENVLSGFDTIIVQRNAISSNNISAFKKICRDNRIQVIFEIDDDLTAIGQRSDEFIDYQNGKGIIEFIKDADAVITSTRTLQERYKIFNQKVFLSENALSERLWFSPLPAQAASFFKLSDRMPGEVRIIYMGTRTHTEDLAMIEEAIKSLCQIRSGVRLFTVGITSDKASWYETIDIPNDCKVYSRFVPWFRTLAGHMDFAVAPLQDNYFNQAKSPLKYYEYSASRLAGIYSAVLPYIDAVRNGETGMLVKSTKDAWLDALIEMIDNPQKRKTILDTAYSEVISKHSLQFEASNLDSIVLELLRNKNT